MSNNINDPRAAIAQAVMRKEFADFFNAMANPGPKWPGCTDSQIIDAIAGALMDMGKQRGLGSAMLQTLVHELQDHVNQSISQ